MRHGDWHGNGNWWWVPMALMMLLAWGTVVWLVLAFTRRDPGRSFTSQPPAPSGPPLSDPTAILDERLARGDIDIEDYRLRVEALLRRAPAP